MNPTRLRSPEQRVGTLPNGALPPPDDDSPSTETLLHSALVLRDGAALETVVRSLRPEMLRLALLYVNSADDAEDVIQDTWVAAVSGIDRYEGRASLRTWFFRILTYRGRSASRHGSRFLPFSYLQKGGQMAGGASGTRPHLVSEGPGPEEELMNGQLRQRLETALAGLPVRQRDVVRLRDIEGWSMQEVCARMRLSPGNQRVLLHRARQQLRAAV